MAAGTIHVNWGWPEMEELLQCPVCFELPTGPVPMCIQGHHICTQCRRKVKSCPLCKAAYSLDTRNFVVEELLANISVIKNLMTLANIVVNTPAKAEKNEILKKSKSKDSSKKDSPKLPAPVQSPGEFPCAFCQILLPVSRMLIHLRYAHSTDLMEVPSENQRAQFVVEFKYQTIRNNGISKHCAVKVDKVGVFFISMDSYPNGQAHIFLRMVVACKDARKYSYSLKIPNHSSNYLSRAVSCREPTRQLYHKHDCLILDADVVRRIMASRRDKLLTVNVTINRNHDDTDII